MSHRPVPVEHLRALAEQADRFNSQQVPVTTPAMRRLTTTLTDAAHRQQSTPGYAAMQIWTRRYRGGRDGIAATSAAPPPDRAQQRRPRCCPFLRGQLHSHEQLPGHGPADDAAEFLVITTRTTSRWTGCAPGRPPAPYCWPPTGLGLATTALSQALEVDTTRHEPRREVLSTPEHPQLVVRLGWPAAAELPRTPRRDLRSVQLWT